MWTAHDCIRIPAPPLRQCTSQTRTKITSLDGATRRGPSASGVPRGTAAFLLLTALFRSLFSRSLKSSRLIFPKISTCRQTSRFVLLLLHLDLRMPQISNTPESLLPRSDSRNPATTCRGITTQGRPCRRALASSQTPNPISRPRKGASHVPDLESLYCWQHKDQAVSSTSWNDSSPPAKPRTSIDTLMDRLGVLEINEQPVPWEIHPRRPNQSNFGEKRKPRPKRTFCCFEVVDDSSDDHTPSRPVQRPQIRPPHGATSSPQNLQNPLQDPAGKPQSVRLPSGQRVSSAPQTRRPSVPNGRRPSTSSQTRSLLSWIPSTLSPKTTSLLLTELSKPISSADDEGYIYMFWVTPQNATARSGGQSPLPRDLASSLLPSAPPNNHLRPPTQPRSVSDAIRVARDLNALTSNPTSTAPGTLRLKIGRTSNVHRRMNEWTRQCSYDLTLIRYYPYTSSVSSSPARTPPASRKRSNSHSAIDAHLIPGRKVRHVHRVERLIHLELGDMRVRDLGRCGECGKEHREWFEVEAAKEALRRVDECVRRWVAWGESMV